MEIFRELPVSFPWYNTSAKQNRFRENFENLDDYGLISPADALLPFQAWVPIPSGGPLNWTIRNLDGTVAATLDATSIALIRSNIREGRKYYYYAGEPLFTSPGGAPLVLSPGFYYGRLSFVGGGFIESEIFRVPECWFLTTTPGSCEFLKFEWWNDTDLRPIYYNDLDLTGKPYFRNVVYLDTFAHSSEPLIEEETINDGAGEAIPTFQKASLRWRITDLVPDFLKRALVLMQMHDHIIFTERRVLRTGEVDKIATNSTPQLGGAYSTVDILFTETLIIKKGCGDNMTA